MSGFDDFLDQVEEPNPPTEKQRKWATENFSSRVDPPIELEEVPPVCVTAPLFEGVPNMYIQGLEINVLFIGHSLVDVPFED